VLIKGCFHRFGQKCLENYLNSDSPRNNRCPQCRREWYKRQTSWTTPRDINVTESLIASSLPREPRVRARRTQYALDHEQATNNNLITSHLDEIFRRLDLIQDIGSEQHTSTADTRVRLQAIERRARRLYGELQVAYEGNTSMQAQPSATMREPLTRQRTRATRQAENVARERGMETSAIALHSDPYSLMVGEDQRRTTVSSTFCTPEETSESVITSPVSTEDVDHPSLSSPSEAPISASQYVEYLRWGQSRISDDDLPRLRESAASSTVTSGFNHEEIDEPRWADLTSHVGLLDPLSPQRSYHWILTSEDLQTFRTTA
jgi:hypothetical protein